MEQVDRPVLDVSKLPTVLFGTKSLTWCGIIGMMAIEGMVFVLMIASYFYLHSRSGRVAST
jgi:cytochrome c oxidase subunit 3